MPLDHIPGKRRAARLALAAGLVAALTAAGPALAVADPAPSSPATGSDAPGEPGKDAADKLGSADATLLAKAKADGDKNVTFMIAGKPGSTAEISSRLHAQGASVGRTYDQLGYVRATVPTAKADAAIGAAQKLPSVLAIDLRQEVKLDDPTPAADTTAAASRHPGKPATTYPGPDRNTPAKNPYQPAFETGAVDFVKDHPTADGRGITIGILDSGVDVGHPALQKTTTGERKIVDWVTSTDPILDGDATWRPMVTAVSGPSFTAAERTWTAPAGSYFFSTFAEAATKGGDMLGDLNRDGDTTDVWGVLYDPAAGTVRVDLDNNGDFGDNAAMKPYKDGFQIGHFGTDDPATAISESIPFTIEIRKGVPMDPYGGPWVGKTADFVNIGLVQSEHGTHVAGITSANGLFGGRMNGAAPGAKIVSSRACTWTGGCTNIALTEGMTDLVVNHHVDVVNMSIGGLGALNDGASARDLLYQQLIDTYGVQLVISAGNDGPGVNTISDPGLADHVLSVGASISRETWAANYGSQTTVPYSLLPFSARGPREDGGLAPVITAPGAAINSVPTWEPGAPVADAGYDLPPGYAMLQGTSMASPQATGAAALLLSAAKGQHLAVTPAQLRTALISTATNIPGFQTVDQGAGLVAVGPAWNLLRQGGTTDTYTVKAPVDTALSSYLRTPGYGTGVYDREGGLAAGQQRTYNVTVTRTSGPAYAQLHTLSWAGNDGTFSVGSPLVVLPLDKPVTVKVTAKPRSAGVHSALLNVDDPLTRGTDTQVAAAVVVSTPIAGPSYTLTRSGTIQRDSTRSYFLTVPAGATSLEVAMGGLKPGSQTRFISIHPYGVPLDSTQTPDCYPNYNNPANTCRPDLRSYADPLPGVWEIEVEARRTSPQLDNPYVLTVSVLGASFDPAVQTVPEAKVGTPAPVSWTVSNGFAPISGGSLSGGPLGSALTATPTIAQGGSRTTSLTLGSGVSRLDVSIGSPSDQQADLDLYVYLDGVLIAQSADGDAEEAVSLADPAPGTYTFEVDGYSVPSGSTTYSYEDVYYSAALGQVTVDTSAPVNLPHGASATVSASVLASAAAPAGRQLFGQVQLLDAGGTPAGTGSVIITSTTP
ncbi:S8 family serine peptidase [Streptomyces cocklensis]|uniref:Subtilase family protein n=2 Tax=Actinacidiphila cocklensis TaxID=887465 RepID=A0A9W4GS41_9ACTN|nr:S8 family serine peptidase [Actinacidiphila cocklensis]MDD1058173.1 S8 family serine peptidase [Actinacidiphila cocklensis]CAG6393222.1 Subtilase family protein [Actinacidiphila cocklensis]